MTSGYMFTRIRNTPFIGGDGSWIAGGFQNQYGQEVQIVALVCMCISFLPPLILLTQRRWHAGSLVPHAHHGYPVPDLRATSTVPDIPLEYYHYAGVLHPCRSFQSQEQRYELHPLVNPTHVLAGYPFRLLM
jgi:hypothetical protein